MTVKEREVPFKKWTFVDKNDLDNEHWYVRLEGGKFHDVIYRYMEIKLNETTKSINFDYEIVDYPFEGMPKAVIVVVSTIIKTQLCIRNNHTIAQPSNHSINNSNKTNTTN